jgi:hypothetical protein
LIKPYQHTKTIVCVSLVLSCLSFGTTKMGWSEIYPFYFWKLYSQPSGWAKEYKMYRVYAKKEGDSKWDRLSVQPRATFNRDEINYFLAPITQQILSKPTAKDSLKLKVFCNYIAPTYRQYKVVEERFNPLDLLKNPMAFDTITVINLEP